MTTRAERKRAREIAKRDGRGGSVPQTESPGHGSRLGVPTREPPFLPGDSSFPQIEVYLTGDEATECIGVRIHGQLHYLHASSARALEQRVHAALEKWNQTVRDFKRDHPELPAAIGIEEV
jgi:hypothetical protein